MTSRFQDRAEIRTGVNVTITTLIVKAVTLVVNTAVQGGPIRQGLKDNFILSCAYWTMNVENSPHVNYSTTGDAAHQHVSTAAGQQGTGFIGLAYLMGLVKEPTTENSPACKKRWAAGLAGVTKANLLPESFMDGVWAYIVEAKPTLYCHNEIRRELLRHYLDNVNNHDDEPPIVRAVLSQLDLVYKDAYLKSVNLMHLFTETGSRVLEIPSVLEEAIKLDEALNQVKAVEGVNYSTCRLIDNNRYPILNHANYPNLYTATLEWARRSKKIQKNYLGSRALQDQAVNQDLVRKILRASATSLSSCTLSQEQIEWLKNRRGYNIPDTPLMELLTTRPQKRRAEALESDASSSESEDESVGESKRAKTRRRH